MIQRDRGVCRSGGLILAAAVMAVVAATNTASAALLDTISGAQAAYSVRKLVDSYAGPAITVRRSSDNATMNIGFDGGGNLDTAALLSFVGAGDGFVTTWYDQVGSADVAQATGTKQPQIVIGGALVTSSNGSAALQFDGNNTTGAGAESDNLYVDGDLLADGAKTTVFTSASIATTSAGNDFYQRYWTFQAANSTRLTLGGATGGKLGYGYRSPGFIAKTTPFVPTLDQTYITTVESDASGGAGADFVNVYVDGGLLTGTSGLSLVTDPDVFVIGAFVEDGQRSLNGTMNELIIYSGALSGVDQATIESSLLNTFVVPEPGTMVMLATGGLLMLRRRRSSVAP